MQVKLSFQKVGEGSGNEAVGVGEFLDRCFHDLAWVIKQNAPQLATQMHLHHHHHEPHLFIRVLTFLLGRKLQTYCNYLILKI